MTAKFQACMSSESLNKAISVPRVVAEWGATWHFYKFPRFLQVAKEVEAQTIVIATACKMIITIILLRLCI